MAWPFKKKKETELPDLDISEEPEILRLQEPIGPPPLQPTAMPQFQQSAMHEDTYRLILAKLETINAQLENLSQRIANLEKIAQASQEPTKPWYARR